MGRGFVRWAGGRRHPREMGALEVQAFLSMLANERHVAAATHRQASAAAGTASPLDALMMTMTMTTTTTMRGRIGDVDHDDDHDRHRDRGGGAHRRDGGAADPDRDPPSRVREPAFPCYRATPSSTARATSAS